MARRSSRAGGIFITLGAVVGLIAGAATGRATLGVLIGTAAGVVGALLVWLIDAGRAR